MEAEKEKKDFSLIGGKGTSRFKARRWGKPKLHPKMTKDGRFEERKEGEEYKRKMKTLSEIEEDGSEEFKNMEDSENLIFGAAKPSYLGELEEEEEHLIDSEEERENGKKRELVSVKADVMAGLERALHAESLNPRNTSAQPENKMKLHNVTEKNEEMRVYNEYKITKYDPQINLPLPLHDTIKVNKELIRKFTNDCVPLYYTVTLIIYYLIFRLSLLSNHKTPGY